MMIPKISLYTSNVKKYQNVKNNAAFGIKYKTNATKNSEKYGVDFFKNSDGYKTIMTYNEIVSLKNLAEKTKIQNMPDNLAVMFIPDALGDTIFATSQNDMNTGKANWVDVTDYDSF